MPTGSGSPVPRCETTVAPAAAGGIDSGFAWDAERARLEELAPGYLDRVRLGVRRLAHRSGTLVDLSEALVEVQETAVVDLEVPTLSSRRVGRLVKVAIKRLTTWYLRYLAQQISASGLAMTRLSALLVARTDKIEESTMALAGDLESLRQRVERLEGTAVGSDQGRGSRA